MATRKIDLMHKLFGEADGKCGDCKHFAEGQYRGMALKKCKIYGMTHSEASDWAKRWKACGCYNRDVPYCNIIRMVRGVRHQEELGIEIVGQITLEGTK